MPKKICLIHANCQGDPLKQLLENCPDFSDIFTIHKYTNYLKEHIPADLFAKCDLMLYQHLDDKWNELSSNSLLSRLPQTATAIQIPNMFFKGYWPLWTNAAKIAFGDIFLEHLIEQKLNLNEIATIYLHGDLSTKYNLTNLYQNSMEIEKNKEKNCKIKTTALIEKLWQKKQLFYSVNHPAEQLILHVAEEILNLLHLPAVPQLLYKTFVAEYENFELPIHPVIGKFFNLPFAKKDRLYNIYGRQMSFAQFATGYAQCRLNGIDDFVSFLHLVPLP